VWGEGEVEIGGEGIHERAVVRTEREQQHRLLR
jgi:hypothetical protein